MRHYRNSEKLFSSNVPSTDGSLPKLISANIFLESDPDRLAFAREVILNRILPGGRTLRIGVTGVAGDMRESVASGTVSGRANMDTLITQPAEQCLAPVIHALRPKVDLLIVLVEGDKTMAVALAKAYPQADVIVFTGDEAAGIIEDGVVGKVKLLQPHNQKGKEIGLAKLISRGSDWGMSEKTAAISITQDGPADPNVSRLLEDFKKATRKLEVKLPGPDVLPIYAGAEACAKCHQSQYQNWRTTRHANAIQTLVNHNQQYNPACLPCHTTGFRNANGFYGFEHGPSKAMINVQCEMCHGPAREHADIKTKLQSPSVKRMMAADEYAAMKTKGQTVIPSRKVPETTCLQCHTPENDRHFVYTEKIRLINHQFMK